jgi:hypothetical protein
MQHVTSTFWHAWMQLLTFYNGWSFNKLTTRAFNFQPSFFLSQLMPLLTRIISDCIFPFLFVMSSWLSDIVQFSFAYLFAIILFIASDCVLLFDIVLSRL